jgi:hypothetical protein
MTRALFYLVLLLYLEGCGVLYPYVYDAQTLQDRLTVSMPKDEVLKRLGRPDRVVRADGQQLIWEYRLYPRGEWAAYLIHCPFFPNCYFPAEAGNPYYVVLQDNELCMWGTPDVVRPLVGIVCGTNGSGPVLRVSTVPVFMPPRIAPLPQRLAVVPADGRFDSEINSWLDLTLNFLRTRHRELVLVEREDLRTVLNEVDLQYGRQADDETTIRVGRLVGADSLLTYRVVLSDTDPKAAALELRLLKVESGTTVFRQMVSANQMLSDAAPTVTARQVKTNPLPRRRVLKNAAAYGLAALAAAFGDNPLGVVSDYAWSGDGIKVMDVLQGGPAFRSGLQPGDQILNCNGRPVGSWSDPLALPARLSVKREGAALEVYVE